MRFAASYEHWLPKKAKSIGAATVYGMLGLLAYFHFIHRAEAIWRERRYYWAVLVICLAVMVFTQSRGPLLALAVTLLATAVYQRDARSTIILIVPLVFYVLAFLGAPEQILSPLTRYGGDSFRIEIWSQALEQIRKAPWLGHGITTVANYETSIGRVETHPHNVFLASLLYGGLLALLILLILVFLALRQGLRTLLAGGDPTLAVLLLFSIACQMTDGHRLLTNPKPVWLFFWLPVALACAAELQGKSGLSSPKEGPATSSRGACR
jgi:O-antigen ligase